MLYLKLGTRADLDDVLNLCYDMYLNSVYSSVLEFKPSIAKESYLESLTVPMNESTTILLMKEGRVIGFISCTVAKFYFSAEKVATEAGFWIYKDDRTKEGLKKLLTAYYYWAKEVGCKAALIGKIDKNNVESYRLKVFDSYGNRNGSGE